MIRMHVTAECQTEQSFVKELLAIHLAEFNVFTDARCVLTSRDKRAAMEYRSGLLSYEKAKKDLQAWIKTDNHPECRFTTMFDLYALPGDFPGYKGSKLISLGEKTSRFCSQVPFTTPPTHTNNERDKTVSLPD